MPTLRADLQRARGRWPQIARDTGVSHSTIARAARGRIPTPQIDTYESLRGWLDANLAATESKAA